MNDTTLNTQLYQVHDKVFGDEKFCFNANSYEEAKTKLFKWVQYHSLNHSDYFIRLTNAPKYSNNIKNEWVN